MVLVRDTKDRGADAVLRITPSGWRRVTAALKR
jgi:hypothetical protein